VCTQGEILDEETGCRDAWTEQNGSTAVSCITAGFRLDLKVLRAETDLCLGEGEVGTA